MNNIIYIYKIVHIGKRVPYNKSILQSEARQFLLVESVIIAIPTLYQCSQVTDLEMPCSMLLKHAAPILTSWLYDSAACYSVSICDAWWWSASLVLHRLKAPLGCPHTESSFARSWLAVSQETPAHWEQLESVSTCAPFNEGGNVGV